VGKQVAPAERTIEKVMLSPAAAFASGAIPVKPAAVARATASKVFFIYFPCVFELSPSTSDIANAEQKTTASCDYFRQNRPARVAATVPRESGSLLL
jgi:hypothetical protein